MVRGIGPAAAPGGRIPQGEAEIEPITYGLVPESRRPADAEEGVQGSQDRVSLAAAGCGIHARSDVESGGGHRYGDVRPRPF
jgi:hypothetical protein